MPHAVLSGRAHHDTTRSARVHSKGKDKSKGSGKNRPSVVFVEQADDDDDRLPDDDEECAQAYSADWTHDDWDAGDNFWANKDEQEALAAFLSAKQQRLACVKNQPHRGFAQSSSSGTSPSNRNASAIAAVDRSKTNPTTEGEVTLRGLRAFGGIGTTTRSVRRCTNCVGVEQFVSDKRETPVAQNVEVFGCAREAPTWISDPRFKLVPFVGELPCLQEGDEDKLQVPTRFSCPWFEPRRRGHFVGVTDSVEVLRLGCTNEAPHRHVGLCLSVYGMRRSLAGVVFARARVPKLPRPLGVGRYGLQVRKSRRLQSEKKHVLPVTFLGAYGGFASPRDAKCRSLAAFVGDLENDGHHGALWRWLDRCRGGEFVWHAAGRGIRPYEFFRTLLGEIGVAMRRRRPRHTRGSLDGALQTTQTTGRKTHT